MGILVLDCETTVDTSLGKQNKAFVTVETVGQLLGVLGIADEIDDSDKPSPLMKYLQASGAVLEAAVGGYEASQAAMMLDSAV
jgi:hypothetical protein